MATGNMQPVPSSGQAPDAQNPARPLTPRTPEEERARLENKLRRVALYIGAEITASLERQTAAHPPKAVAFDFGVCPNTLKNWRERPDTLAACALPQFLLNDPDPDVLVRISNWLRDADGAMAKYRQRVGEQAVVLPKARWESEESLP